LGNDPNGGIGMAKRRMLTTLEGTSRFPDKQRGGNKSRRKLDFGQPADKPRITTISSEKKKEQTQEN